MLLLVVVALFLAAGLNPAVGCFERRGLRRSFAVAAVIVGGARRAGAVRPGDRPGDQPTRSPRSPTTRPAGSTSSRSNRQVQQLDDEYDIIDKVKDYVANGDFVSGLFGGVARLRVCRCLDALFNTFIVVVLTLYFLASLETTKHAFYGLAPASRRERVSKLGDRIMRDIGGYVSGAFVVALCAGLSSLVFLFVVGLGEYAVALAFVVALLDVIPMIGATLGAVIVSAIGFATDPDGHRLHGLLRRSTSRSRTTSSTRG